jgi:hypothetical protein
LAKSITSTTTGPAPAETKTYSICMNDGRGHSDVQKVDCSSDELGQAVQSCCREFAYIELTPGSKESEVSVAYRIYEGCHIYSADYLRFMAARFLYNCKDGEKNEDAKILVNVAADIEREKAVLVAAGSVTVTYDTEWITECGQAGCEVPDSVHS